MAVRVPPKGTRGTRFPRFVSGLFSRFMVRQFRKRSEAIAEFEGGRRIEVDAESLQGDDLAAAWDRIGREAPEYVKYLSQTDRDISVIRLRQPG